MRRADLLQIRGRAVAPLSALRRSRNTKKGKRTLVFFSFFASGIGDLDRASVDDGQRLLAAVVPFTPDTHVGRA